MKDDRRIELNENLNKIDFAAGVITDISLNAKVRGFEIVDDKYRKNIDSEIQLPIRADLESAGYDFRTPIEVTINPGEKVLIWTDIKAYMQPNEVLQLYVRSSLGVKKGLTLANTVGVIDASYYNSADTNGNIGITLVNFGKQVVKLEAGERICQGVFTTYLTADNDTVINKTRSGGFGSSGNI